MIEITIRCDVCDTAGDSRSNARGRGGGRSAIGDLRREVASTGWRVRVGGGGRDICPKCLPACDGTRNVNTA